MFKTNLRHATIVPAGQPTLVIKEHKDEVRAVAWHPTNENLLATGAQDKAVLIVDVTSGAVRARLLGHTSEVNALAWSQCQEGLLASCSDDGIKIWESGNTEAVYSFKGHTGTEIPLY